MAEVVVVVGGRGAYSIVSIKRTVGFSTVTVLKNTVRLIETIKYVSPDFGRIEGAAGKTTCPLRFSDLAPSPSSLP